MGNKKTIKRERKKTEKAVMEGRQEESQARENIHKRGIKKF